MDDADKSDLRMEAELNLILKSGAYRRAQTGLGPRQCAHCGAPNDLRAEGSEWCSDCREEGPCHG